VQHRFTGQPQDDQAGGLYNYGARFYNAKWGRFISPDEVVQGFDSQGLNPFTYVLNTPTSATDPTGNYIYNGFVVPSSAMQAAGEARAAEYAISRDEHRAAKRDGGGVGAPASSAAEAFAEAGALGFMPVGPRSGDTNLNVTPLEYVREMIRSEFLDIAGGAAGTAVGLADGLVRLVDGLLTLGWENVAEGAWRTLKTLSMPRLGRDGGLGHGGPGSTIPASNSKVQRASNWHDREVDLYGFGSSATQFGWIRRAWRGDGVEPGPYGQAYRLLGTVGFGIAGGVQWALGK
jgi:RHS repeat-associated protein